MSVRYSYLVRYGIDPIALVKTAVRNGWAKFPERTEPADYPKHPSKPRPATGISRCPAEIAMQCQEEP